MKKQKEFKEFKRFKSTKDKRNKEMARDSGGAILIISGILILVIAVAFFLPLSSKQYFNVIVTGSDQNSKVADIGFLDIKGPAIEIFSRSNPPGQLNLDVLVTNQTGDTLVNTTLYNLGLGELNFPVTGPIIKGNLTINYALYHNNVIVDKGKINQVVESNAKK